MCTHVCSTGVTTIGRGEADLHNADMRHVLGRQCGYKAGPAGGLHVPPYIHIGCLRLIRSALSVGGAMYGLFKVFRVCAKCRSLENAANTQKRRWKYWRWIAPCDALLVVGARAASSDTSHAYYGLLHPVDYTNHVHACHVLPWRSLAGATCTWPPQPLFEQERAVHSCIVA